MFKNLLEVAILNNIKENGFNLLSENSIDDYIKEIINYLDPNINFDIGEYSLKNNGNTRDVSVRELSRLFDYRLEYSVPYKGSKLYFESILEQAGYDFNCNIETTNSATWYPRHELKFSIYITGYEVGDRLDILKKDIEKVKAAYHEFKKYYLHNIRYGANKEEKYWLNNLRNKLIKAKKMGIGIV